MKFRSAAPDGNQDSDLEPARYFNLAIEHLEAAAGQSIAAQGQTMLGDMEVLVYMGRKYPPMAGRRIKPEKIGRWEKAFSAWSVQRRLETSEPEGMLEHFAKKSFQELEGYAAGDDAVMHSMEPLPANPDARTYVILAIEQITEVSDFYKTSDQPVHVMLVHVDILVYLLTLYPQTRELVSSGMKDEWENSFYDWFSRCSAKIPAKYRSGIKDSADQLFAQLEGL
jgi:hypothetical protein